MHRIARTTLIAGLTGTLMVSAAWAGIGLAPVPVPSLPAGGAEAVSELVAGDAVGAASTGGDPTLLGAGELLVGAAKNSMDPRPEDGADFGFPGAVWEKDPAKCKTTEPAWFSQLPESALNALDGIANPGSVWPENPNCIYQGGFGLGPLNPVKGFDQEFGLWVRSMAISDGNETIITTVIDGEGWLWDYRSKCTDCGAKQIAEALGSDPELDAFGVTSASHILHATHSHAAPDFIGGWGFVPNWYMAQITETIKATAKQAVLSMEAARLEAGEQEARAHNGERRGTYRSAEEAQISWLRAVAVNATPPAPAEPAEPAVPAAAAAAPAAAEEPSPSTAPGNGKGPKKPGASPSASPTATATATASPTPTTEPTPDPAARVIATLGAFAAHPVTYGGAEGMAHPDWVGLFNKRLEERFGGIGLHFMTGLGNMTGANRLTGGKLADLIPEVGGGRLVTDTTVKVSRGTASSAVTNVPLDTLGSIGLFDRKFNNTPAVVNTGKSANAPCLSASPQSVELPYTAARIGKDIILTAAPGEVFSNYTNTIKEKNAGRITFPLAQSNDALGYMPQSFEINPVGQQGLGFAAGGYVFVNYEDSYAIDRCTGDLMLEETLKLLATVKQ